MYIAVTDIDSKTGELCTVSPMRNGPAQPKVKGFQILFNDQSNWPIATVGGVYASTPLYYGTCDADADITLKGVVQTFTLAQFTAAKRAEFFARMHYASWIFNEETLLYDAPVPYPDDGKDYQWDEEVINWVEVIIE